MRTLARITVVLLLAGGSARAQETAPAAAPAAAPASGASAAPAPRVRASHRVDVIAPGERVETVIDRLRAGRPGGAGAPQRAPGGAPPGGRGPPGAEPGAKPPPGGAHAPGAGPAPPLGPRAGPMPGRLGPAPLDRPRR